MRPEILLLLSFLAVIAALIACRPPRNPTPTLSPTLFPAVTLTAYHPQFVMRPSPASLPVAAILPPASRLDQIRISPPRCYALGSQRITCLGRLSNQTDGNVGDITLQARYMDVNGALQGQELFTLEQRRVNRNDVAAYRINVPNARLETRYLEIQVAAARLSAQPSLALDMTDMQGSYRQDDNRYLFTAQLENATAFDATDARLIVTLENNEGVIIGYRAFDLPGDIPSGARLPIRLSIVPLEATANIRYRAVLHALPSSSRPIAAD